MTIDLSGLNEQQRKAALHKDGPLLVLAGAGSGKTHTMTERMGVLVENYGVDPDNILAITFTNKAANEMKERAIKKFGNVGKRMTISTFHSLCVKLLRKEIHRLEPYNTNFSIFDTDDTKALIKGILKELELDEKEHPAKIYQTFISKFKNELLMPRDVEKLMAWSRNPFHITDPAKEFPIYLNLEQSMEVVRRIPDLFHLNVLEIYKRYQERLRKNNAVDFDDMIFLTVILFLEHPRVLGHYQDVFRYIMIDEYQDTNHAQYILAKLLAAKYRNIAVIGDDYQCIYRFRNANIHNILNFEKDYPEAVVIMLEQNYRSTQHILDLANKVISFNKKQKHKTLWTNKGKGEPVQYRVCHNTEAEAREVVREIMKLRLLGKYENKDFAVLYRINAQSRAFEEELVRNGIAYNVVGSLNFYQRKEIKDIIAYLRVILNTNDSLSLQRIINSPKRGIGNSTLEKVNVFASKQQITMWEAFKRADEYLNGSTATKLKQFVSLIETLQSASKQYRVGELVEVILEDSGYRKALETQNTEEAEDRLENLQEFLNIAWEFQEQENANLETFLERISLVVEETENTNEKEKNGNKVILQTIHASKGLEYPVVFLVGVEENLLPYYRSMGDDDDIEEERRLCYVGITRAKELLYVLRARERRLYNDIVANEPSRFLYEMEFETEKEEDNFKLPW